MRAFGKVAVAVRVGHSPDPLFFKCWTELLLSGVCEMVISPIIEVPAHWAANTIADLFLTTDADTVLYLDDDAVFLPGAVTIMQENPGNADYDIVQGLTVSAKPPHAPLLLHATAIDGRYIPYAPKLNAPDETVDVGMVGLHFTFIRRRVFDAVRKAIGPQELFFSWGDSGYGEDEMFCRKARKLGMRIGVDLSVSIEHRCSVAISYDKTTGGSQYRAYSNPAFLQTILAQDKRVRDDEQHIEKGADHGRT